MTCSRVFGRSKSIKNSHLMRTEREWERERVKIETSSEKQTAAAQAEPKRAESSGAGPVA